MFATRQQPIKPAPAATRFPPYKGVSPRVTADTYASHRGEFVSVIFELTGPG